MKAAPTTGRRSVFFVFLAILTIFSLFMYRLKLERSDVVVVHSGLWICAFCAVPRRDSTIRHHKFLPSTNQQSRPSNQNYLSLASNLVQNGPSDVTQDLCPTSNNCNCYFSGFSAALVRCGGQTKTFSSSSRLALFFAPNKAVGTNACEHNFLLQPLQ